MRKNDRYKLLYNQLWVATTDKVLKLNSDFVPADYLDFDLEVLGKESVSHSSIAQVAKSPPIDYNRLIAAAKAPSAPEEVSTLVKPQPMLLNDELITNWDNLTAQVTNCSKCNLSNTRKNVVIERGNRAAKWMFVGEGPGEQEDIDGLPFVGASGQLLDKMIHAMKLDINLDVYICNVVKCRPPYNRNPEVNEINACKNYLLSQIANVRPQIIIALGRFASQTLLDSNLAIGKLRNKQHSFQGTPLVVTYHPSYLLRNPAAKKEAWEDLQLAMKIFGIQN